MRQGASWTVNFGADGTLDGPNFVVEEPGIYEVILEIKSETEAVLSLNKVGDAEDPEAPEKTEEELNAWSVIGAICGTAWDTDFPMTEVEEGFFESAILELKADDEFKCRQGADWAVNIGVDGENFKVEADGTYKVRLDVANEAIELVPAEHVWGVVGSFNGWGGDGEDIAMTEVEEGIFECEPTAFTADTELKVRQDADWTVNYGADGAGGANLKVEADGTYIVRLDLAAETVELIAQ